MNATRLSITAALSLLAAACGGGGGAEPVPPAAAPAAAEVPASAYASSGAFAAYAGQLKADDQAEPLDLAGGTPPTSETDDPAGS